MVATGGVGDSGSGGDDGGGDDDDLELVAIREDVTSLGA